MRLPWKRRRRPPLPPRPDYTAIAVLEHDLFGIQPEPGTTAAAIIGLRSFQSAIGAVSPPRFGGPEFGGGLVSRPSPFLLEPGERIVPLSQNRSLRRS